MPPINISNTAYEKVALFDEYDENDMWQKKKTVDERDTNANDIYHQYESFQKDATTEYLPETKVQLNPEVFLKPSSNVSDSKYPKEKRKFVIAFLMMIFSFIFNCVSIVLTHQKVPDRDLHPHLPDISLDNIAKIRWFNDLADILVVLFITKSALIATLHRHRWIICRRIFLILSMLYCLRSVTMYVTVLPLANNHVYCSPKLNQTLSYGQTILTITEEVLKLIHSGGLPMTGRKTLCGDYIFSGHTIILMMGYLLVREYIPKRYSIIQWLSWIIAWTGIISLLVSHGHYTIDVLIGYYATTRLFWIYHTLSNNPGLKRKSSSNALSDVWWFPVFQYFEANVSGKLPKEYSISRLRRRILTFSLK